MLMSAVHLGRHLSLLLAIMAMGAGSVHAADRDAARIKPWEQDHRYWQFKGQPVLLLGGSDQDNLFNHPDIPPAGLQSQLDTLASVGGNYLRNTMSSRDEGENVWEFDRDPATGLYDLTRFQDEYWNRFKNFLQMTADRDIIVQIEVFDRFDYAREPWELNPFNPKNNINYTTQESGLPEKIDTHPGQRENPFFRSLPELENIQVLLPFQRSRVAKMLEISLNYDHVLYCVSNETNDSEEWSRYWANFIREQASEAGVPVEVTEMWDSHDLTHPTHRRTFDHPDLYSFVDTSQNNHQRGQMHWDNMQAARRMLADPPRPMNNVKIYGGERHGGGIKEGTDKFWRNILGGLASSRFHRPGPEPGLYGVGLHELAQTHLRSARLLMDAFDVFAAEPTLDLLHERAENEAYLTAVVGQQYALFFPDGGSVELDLSDVQGTLQLRWLNILDSEWTNESQVRGGQRLRIDTPGKGEWAAVLVRQ